jgi:serine/threonine-protein kinase
VKNPGETRNLREIQETRPGEPERDDIGELLRALEGELSARLANEGTLGTGGMARVDLVHDRALDRDVVVKQLHGELEQDPRTLAMFVREARITGRLEHPNIVPVHDIGVDAKRSVYFTMKRVEGRTLTEVIEAFPPGPLSHDALLDLLDVVVKVIDALAFAHSRGFVHLDVKPANVMVGDFGQVYLMDWGVARRIRGGAPAREDAPAEHLGEQASGASGAVLVGTATHMAPEQARGMTELLDVRTDVFAVGALLFHALTRSAPYEAEGYWAALVRAQSCEHEPLEAAAPWVPEALTAIVKRAMSLDPDERYPTMAELRHDLVAFTRGGGLFAAVSFAAGQQVVREGEPGDCAYIIESGSLEVVRAEGGELRRLRTMGPGEVFGEMAILAPGPRTASVIALEDSTLRRVTAETLAREVESLKPWMGAMLRTLATRFREREETRTREG